MAMFYVEKQPWQRWPKVLTVCRNGEDGIERRRYVPERTCKVEATFLNEYGYAPQLDDFTFELSCGHSVTWDERPDYCPWCGAKVV